LLLLPTATYRATDFLAAARALDVDVVVGSERRRRCRTRWRSRHRHSLRDLDAAVDAIAELHARHPLDAVLAVDDPGVLIACAASSRLGFRHNPLEAVVAARDKIVMRELSRRHRSASPSSGLFPPKATWPLWPRRLDSPAS